MASALKVERIEGTAPVDEAEAVDDRVVGRRGVDGALNRGMVDLFFRQILRAKCG